MHSRFIPGLFLILFLGAHVQVEASQTYWRTNTWYGYGSTKEIACLNSALQRNWPSNEVFDYSEVNGSGQCIHYYTRGCCSNQSNSQTFSQQTCPAGEEWVDGDSVETFGECAIPGLNCGPDQIEATWTVGGQSTQVCETVLPTTDDPESDCTIISWFEGIPLCEEDQGACALAGGSFGFVGEGANQVARCIPGELSNELPSCQTGEVLKTDTFGNHYCGFPLEPHDTPNQEPSPELDTDGDGIPDHADGDIDGDGTPNSTDNDIDGDGINNADDPSPYGELDQEDDGESSEVDGGGSCNAAPSCTGDAIQCAILYQSYQTRCAIEEAFDPNDVPGYSGSVEDITAPDEDLTSTLDGVLDQVGAAGSCPAPQVFNLGGTQIDIPYTFMCDFASLIRPLVILLFGFAGFRIVMRAFS